MKKQNDSAFSVGLSQETLKLIACAAMLLDHIGAVFFPGAVLRDIGRLSFPIFCFLLAEGFYHTRNRKKYALRLLGAMLLAELPFDLAFFGRIYWGHQNVMLTLLLGFLAVRAVNGLKSGAAKGLIAVGLTVAAEYLRADYGGTGVLLILMFALTRELPGKNWLRFGLMLFLFAGMPSITVLRIGTFGITQQMLGTLAMIPIALYSGEKRTSSKAVQLGFYLFYPVHLAILSLIA